MPSNRDYTALERTPSSMASLIGKRVRIKGQLDRLRRMRSTLSEQIAGLERELKALDPADAVRIGDPAALREAVGEPGQQ